MPSSTPPDSCPGRFRSSPPDSSPDSSPGSSPVRSSLSVLAVVTALTKIATGYWAARRAGISAKGRWRAGGTLVARGEFSIVIAGLTVTAGIEPSLGPLATAYVLILVIAGPLTARWTEPVAMWATGRLRGPAAAGPGDGGASSRASVGSPEHEALNEQEAAADRA